MFGRSFLFVLAVSAVPAGAEITDSTPVIEAAGEGLTKAEFEELVRGRPAYQAQASDPAQKRELGRSFGKAFALEGEARRRKIDQRPKVRLQIRALAQQVLAQELLVELREEYRKDETSLRKRYEENKNLYTQPRVRQILIRFAGSETAARPGFRELTEAEARQKAVQLLGQLRSGADFAKLAAEHSDDSLTRARGGEMGPIQRGSTDARFENAAFTQPVGQVSEPVKTKFGFHLIRVDSRDPESFDSVKEMLANDLAHREMDRLIFNGFKINEDYFGKEPASSQPR